MKTMKPRAKSKKSNGRFGRVKFANKESGETDAAGPDLSQLRKPIDISVSSLLDVTKLLEIGGDEVKSMLSYECDIVYECRVCRSLFRSLANFISHKRVYCREKFNVAAICRKARNDHLVPAGTGVADPEDNGRSKEDANIRILRSQAGRQSSKKDLTSVVDMLQKKRSEDINENLLESSCGLGKFSSDFGLEAEAVNQQVLLEAIDSTRTAVYQTATTPPALSTVHTADLMKAQMIELQKMVGRNTAILNPDGRSIDTNQMEKSDSPLQIYGCSDDEDLGADLNCTPNLVCTVCNAKFSTRKTLTYHMKSLHVSYRTCYPCPCCSSTFANSWSVYRHLFKVHRKTNEQVRKLRTQIQEKAFRKETTGAEDIEKENASGKSLTEQQTSNNTQEWMEHFELDLELQRCGGCGRRFDRRAALISHSQLCQKRIAACNGASGGGSKGKRLSKTPSPNNVVEENVESNISPKHSARTEGVVVTRAQSNRKQIPRKKETLPVEESPVIEREFTREDTPPEIINNSETSIRVENVSRISDADWEMIGSNLAARCPINGTLSPVSDTSLGRYGTQSGDEFNVPDSPEVIFTSIDQARTVAISFGPKKRRVSLINHSKELANGSDATENPEPISPRSNSDMETNSTDHMIMMENRIATIANLRKLQCLPCRRKFTSMTNLRRHMAIHIGWNRYRCKLCDFKCFVKCDCVAHCNKVHDAKNNRSIIADMVVQIPPDQSTLGQEIMMDLSQSLEANSEPELIDVSALSPKPIEDNESRNFNCFKPQEQTAKEVNSEPEEEAKSSDDKDKPQPTTPEKIEPASKEQREKANPEEPNFEDGQGRLDKDPDLRKMVMEVIFGTSTNDSAACSETEEVRELRASEEGKNGSKAEESKLAESAKGSRATKMVNENRKSSSYLSAAAARLEASKRQRQRPTRNRVKPVNDDFIYDLAEVIRKESAIHRATVLAAHKTLKKKSSHDSRTEGVLPSLLSCKKGSESSSYHSRFSLKQAEIKLSPSNGTKISVSSSQK